MKTKQQVQEENKDCTVFTLEEFEECLDNGGITLCDGFGYFHDGEKETDTGVWEDLLPWEDVENYPYVCWYNK